ncbi:ubiquitin carboxyl-terminal hydrolase [Anaeramoeba flamelloides]|uniref:Ubiquitin carboxyl-terminal hydrolase n=1 Tax=Anaeramoeba flamelloides TaxID=1746091 RepID=A0ABQ8YSC9_9EUKA|nr:ubiquitin carboxyl-terminal hydrolase [Anaeramoeba flamelloides]
MLFSIKKFVKRILETKLIDLQGKPDLLNIMKALKQLTIIYFSSEEPIDTLDFIKNIKWGGKFIDIRNQEDVQEFLIFLLDQIDAYFQSLKEESPITFLFQNQIDLEFTCNLGHMKTHRDCQTTISLAINNCSKLEDSLDNLCSVEEMGKDNRVFCEKYILKYSKKRFNLDLEYHQNKYDYHLHGVIVHKGSKNNGHYYFILKNKDQFVEFNDSKIENISEEKFKNKTFGNSSSMESAYILIYKREKFIIDNPRDFYPNYPIKQYEKDFYRRVLHEVPRSPYTYVIDHQNKIITEIMPFSEYEGPKTDPQTLIELGYIRKEAEIESDCSDGINFGGDPFSNFEDSDSRLFENKDINSSEINQKSKIEKRIQNSDYWTKELPKKRKVVLKTFDISSDSESSDSDFQLNKRSKKVKNRNKTPKKTTIKEKISPKERSQLKRIIQEEENYEHLKLKYQLKSEKRKRKRKIEKSIKKNNYKKRRYNHLNSVSKKINFEKIKSDLVLNNIKNQANSEKKNTRNVKNFISNIEKVKISKLLSKKDFCDMRNELGRVVSLKIVQKKVFELTKWKPSKSWVSLFLHKNGFSSQKAIHKSPQQLSSDFKKRVKQFRIKISKIVKKREEYSQVYPNFEIWAMDEKGIWDYSPQLRTFTRRKKTKSNPYVSGLNDTRQNGRDTLAATVSFSGKQLPAFTIQHRRRKTKTITTDGIKRNVIVDKGCAGMNGILFQKWVVFF